MLQFQIEIEQLFHKNQLVPRIKGEFTECSKADFAAHMDKHGIDQEFGFALLVQMVLHKRATLPTMVGILRRYFDGSPQATADAIKKACEADLVDWNPVTRQLVVKFDITRDVQEELDHYQFPLPMVVEPRPLQKNSDNGYYTGGGSLILRDNHHDKDICLDHLNRVNKTKFRLNRKVADTIKNRWRNLDKPKEDEDHKEYQKRVRAFEKYDRTAHDVIEHLGLSNEGDFYLTHKYDKRGRTYCQGYHVNYQGTPWNKAVIEFANQEITNG